MFPALESREIGTPTPFLRTVMPILPIWPRRAAALSSSAVSVALPEILAPFVQHTSKIFDFSYAASSSHWEEAGRVDFPFRLIFLSLKVISCR